MDSLYSSICPSAHKPPLATALPRKTQQQGGASVIVLPRRTDSFDYENRLAEPKDKQNAPAPKKETHRLLPVLAAATLGVVAAAVGISFLYKPSREKWVQAFSRKKDSATPKTTRTKTPRTKVDSVPEQGKASLQSTPDRNVIAGIYETLIGKTAIDPWRYTLKHGGLNLQEFSEVQHHCLAVVKDPQAVLGKPSLSSADKDKLEAVSGYVIEQLKNPPKASPLLGLEDEEKRLALACAYYNQALLLAMLDRPASVLKQSFHQCGEQLKTLGNWRGGIPASQQWLQMKPHLPRFNQPLRAAETLRKTLYPTIARGEFNQSTKRFANQSQINRQLNTAKALKKSITMVDLQIK